MAGPCVLQVNVSAGGIPKLPVEQAWVSRLGVEGDGHNARTVHGGPHRAVCLFGIEAIERLQAEGHPVEPGGVGENLTTLGIEWSTLPVGTRARVGEGLLLELANATAPCSTQKPNFIGGRFSRISIDLHPADSRMYARVLEEGTVRPGDAIEILPPAPDSRAQAELKLARLDRAMAKANLVGWRAASAAGHDVRVKEDGELAMAAAPGLQRPAFNKALGLAGLPNMLRVATDFYERHGSAGWLVTEDAPWPGAASELELAVYAADPRTVGGAALSSELTVRQIDAAEAAQVVDVLVAANAFGSDTSDVLARTWQEVIRGVAAHPHGAVMLVWQSGVPIATSATYFHHATAWLRAAAVVPEARGRGLQRMMIAARARLAAEHGCDLIGAEAEVGTVSARNLEQMGFEWIGTRREYRYVPARLELVAR